MRAECSHKRICAEYERLLTLCQKSLASWRNQRDEFIRFGLRGKKVADELLRITPGHTRACCCAKSIARPAASARKSVGTIMRASCVLPWTSNIQPPE
jgi:hypothetical protein